MGMKFSEGDELFNKFLRYDRWLMQLLSITGKHAIVDSFPWLQYFGNDTAKQFKALNKLLDEMYVASKEVVNNAEEDSMSILAELMTLAKNGKIYGGEKRMIKTFSNMLQGGMSTTRSTLFSFINILSQNTDIQDKLQVINVIF